MVPQPQEPELLVEMDVRVEEGRKSRCRPSISSLASEIDPELLRAVPLDVCLQSCGGHWSTSRAADDYNLSQRVEMIDSFLSHDWKTKRWLKTLTLLLYFNSVPAAWASLIACILSCVLIIFGSLPGGWLTGTLLTHASF